MGEKFTNPYLERQDRLFQIAEVMSGMATCPRRSVGCLILDADYNIISTGYNGAPEGLPTCLNEECVIEGGHCVRAVHAEIRAIANAARRGVRIEGGTAYCTLLPCIQCMHALAVAGIYWTYYDESYDREEKEHLFQLAKASDIHLIERTRHER